MCCFAEFVVKYVLIIANIVFALAGLAIVVVGTIAHVNLNDIHDVIPVSLSFLTISIIVVGCIVFVIAFCACCGAIRESRFMLISYAVFMAILAGVKIYFTVVIFKFLGNTLQNVSEWLIEAFGNTSIRPAYHAMETVFQCCGTVGAVSYPATLEQIPPSCCPNPSMVATQCDLSNSYEGCITKLTSYFDSFGEAIGGVLIAIIIVECVCLIFGLFLACQIRNRKYA